MENCSIEVVALVVQHKAHRGVPSRRDRWASQVHKGVAALLRVASLVAAGVVLGGCGETAAEPADPYGTWKKLVTYEWSMAPGEEGSVDVPITPERDYVITGIRPIMPPGTHHIVLQQWGDLDTTVWVSAIGSREYLFPEGVGMRLPAGETFVMNLHLFNASSSQRSGISGLEMLLADPAVPIEESNVLNPRVKNFNVPPGPSSLSGQCTLTQDQTFFAVNPHMHQMGKHMTVTLVHDGVETTLFDDKFNWDGQTVLPLQKIEAYKGDVVNLRCDYYNNTTTTLVEGGNAENEMCTVFVHRYPVGSSHYCTY